MSISKRTYLVLLFIVIVSLLYHFLGCFYLYDFTNDEGGWLINAKNKVLFGVFSLEGLYPTALSPLNTFFHTFFFKLFGPSIWIGRYISIIFSLATIVLFFLFVNRQYNSKIAAFATFLIAADTIYNRTTTYAYLESKVYFFIILALILCFSSKLWLKRLAFLPFGLALAFKINRIYLAMPFLYLMLIDITKESQGGLRLSRDNVKASILFLLGSMVVGGIFFYLAYTYNPVFFEETIRSHLSWRFSITRVFEVFSLKSDFFHALRSLISRSPVAWIGFLWSFLYTCSQKKKNPLEKFLLIWIFCLTCYQLFQNYNSTNYLLDLIFPLSIIFAKSLLTTLTRIRVYMTLFICMLMGIIQIGGTFYYYLVIKTDRPSIEMSRWLETRGGKDDIILAPFQVSIGLLKKTLTTSSSFTIGRLLRNKEIKYPVLCVFQENFNVIFLEDKIFLRENNGLIKRIGFYSVHEILKI